MRERRQAERYSLAGVEDFSLDADVVDLSSAGLVVQSGVPLVRGRRYRLGLRAADRPEPETQFSGIVVWARQISAEPRYQVAFEIDTETSSAVEARTVTILPADGGVLGRIPWQTEGTHVDPPDRAFIARDLSLSGMLMELPERRPPAIVFGVEIVLGEELFHCLGHVVRTISEETSPSVYLHGVAFTDVADEEQRRLRRWIHAEHNHAIAGSR